MSIKIPVSAPAFVGNEKLYVNDCLESTWISSTGDYLTRFEQTFADFCGVKYAVACCNGTMALHAALLGLGVRDGDEVLIPSLTYVATANAVNYCGAVPVLVDSEAETWNMDPSLIEAKITKRTKGIICVHLYGHPTDMDPVMDVAKRHGLFVLEDAAEAHGAEYKARRVGSIGDLSVFSFYGNKIVTCGEGGIVLTDNYDVARRIRQIKGQGQDFERRYWFPVIGYNYRMTNIQAAIGLAQVEKIAWHLQRRREVAGWYRQFIGNDDRFRLSPERPWARNSFWMNCVLLNGYSGQLRNSVMEGLANAGIETRPFFCPMHRLPMYRQSDAEFPVAEKLSEQGINLPSSATLTYDEVAYVCRSLIECCQVGNRPHRV